MPSSRHLVDPALLEPINAFQTFELSAETFAIMRQSIAVRFGQAVADDPMVWAEMFAIPGPTDPICRVISRCE
jgi:hypothetical protein